MANRAYGDAINAIRYAAFLRGINVGGHRLIKMTDLARIFSDIGLADVRTVIASGNVVFSSDECDEVALAQRIERSLAVALGYDVDVMLRSVDRLKVLIERTPFDGKNSADHAYVTFLKVAPSGVPALPVIAPEEGYAVLAVEGREILWTASKQPNGRSGDPTKFFTKTFGRIPATTRNWNTIVKIAAM